MCGSAKICHSREEILHFCENHAIIHSIQAYSWKMGGESMIQRYQVKSSGIVPIFGLFVSLLALMISCNVALASPILYFCGDGRVSAVDLATGSAKKQFGYSSDIALSPDGELLYGVGGSGLMVYDIEKNLFTLMPEVVPGSNSAALRPGGGELYAVNSAENVLNVVDTSSYAVTATIPLPDGSYSNRDITVHPYGEKIFLTNGQANSVSVIDVASRKVTATIPVGSMPYSITCNPSGTKAYVTNNYSSSLSVIDTTSLTVTATISVGDYPYGVAVSPDGKKVYVASYQSSNVSVIDAETDKVAATIPLDSPPSAVLVSPDGATVYAGAPGKIYVIDGTTNSVAETISMPGLYWVTRMVLGWREPPSHTLNISKEGTGYGSVSAYIVNSNIQNISCGDTCTPTYWVGSHLYLYAQPDPNYVFEGWSGACAGTSPQCWLTMYSDLTVSAIFGNDLRPVLTVTKQGGEAGYVTSNPSGIYCGPSCSAKFEPGTTVTLSAMVYQSGYLFAGWSGACTGTSETCTLTLTEDVTATAMFSTIPKKSLQVTRKGDGDGTVTSLPWGINCGADCLESFNPGTYVTLNAVPDSDNSIFVGWSGACQGKATPCTLMMTADLTATAEFILKRTFDSSEYFPLTPNTAWSYSLTGNQTQNITVLKNKVSINGTKASALKALPGGAEAYYTSDDEGIRFHGQLVPNIYVEGRGTYKGKITLIPPIKMANGTAQTGQTSHSQGTAHYVIPGLGWADVPYTANYVVDGAETVTVPAGTFEALRLSYTMAIGNQTQTGVLYLARQVGEIKETWTFSGQESGLELVSTNADTHDFAITGITAPNLVTLTKRIKSKTSPVKVAVQNRSPFPEVIKDAEALGELVTLTVQSLGNCPNPTPVLVPPNRFPITLQPKAPLTVNYNVTFDCVNDPEQGTAKDPNHYDYRFAATVNYAALDGKADTHPVDDMCPRSVTPPFVIDPNPDGTVKDSGCGTPKADGTRGGDILTDVVAR
jgi:uncharacterized repeat protein (TIGR02543 family)